LAAPVFDLVVVGYGAAGAATAIAAHELGLSVAIAEKNPSSRHTPSTRMSGGAVMSVDDVEEGSEYLIAAAGGMVPAEVCRAWAEKAHDVLEWLEEVAPDVGMQPIGGAEHPELPGAGAMRKQTPGGSLAGGCGRRLFDGLAAAVAQREIPVLWETPAVRLVRAMDQERRVVGVQVGGADPRVLEARGGVMLSCGGYEFHEEMKLNYLKASGIHFYGNPANQGDGVRMALDAGADLWHMNQMTGRGILHFDDFETGFIAKMAPGGYAIVDQSGGRYANETAQAALRHDFYYHMLEFDPATMTYPRIPSFWIFDQRRFAAGPLTFVELGAPAVGLYDWSDDNSAELARGWIVQAPTITELAARAGLHHPDVLAATVTDYNDGCLRGADRFGRDVESLVPLDDPPYYAVELYPGGTNTSGGPRRDEHARILDPFGLPIPGLYGAGELGEAIGLLYPAGGANISDALCFGRLAATHCAQQLAAV